MTPTQEALVLDNGKLVWHIVRRMVRPYPTDPEDWHSIGMVGLVKAALVYDPSRGIQFSTVAVPCIQHEIYTEKRRRNAKGRRVTGLLSLDDPIRDKHGNVRTIADLTPDPSADVDRAMFEREQFDYLLGSTIKLTVRERMVLSGTLDGMMQREIAETLDISQAHVSRIWKRAVAKLRRGYEEG